MQKNKFREFNSAIVRIPPLSIANGITTQQERVDATLARKQHEHYVTALGNIGISVSMLNSEESLPDSHFVEDAAIIYNDTVILTNPGANSRKAEVELLKKHLPKHLRVIELSDNSHASLDGGDVLFMGNHVFIGISGRTNFSGAESLATILQNLNPNLTTHYIEFSGVLHLKSGLSALNEELLLGSPHMNLKHPFPIGKIIFVPQEEGYAANVLVANGAALVFDECKETQNILRQANLNPIPLDLSEFRKMDGSFTCLSLLH